MKLKGKKIEGPNIETIVIPRGSDPENYLVFKAQAVLDFSEFDALCPRPEPPVKLLKGGKRTIDKEAPTFQTAANLWGMRRFAWTVIKSLEATEDLEWETVDFGNPDSWSNYEQELHDAGFTIAEMNLLLDGVMTANSMNSEKLDQAREAFLASLGTELPGQ